MSGDTARGGFVFQDYYLLKRLLAEAAGRLDELWRRADRGGGDWRDHDLARFGIEAKVPTTGAVSEGWDLNARDWDVLIERAGRLELIEVKSGVLTRGDMRVFWSRLRREGAGRGGKRTLVPVLAVDPENAGPLLGKLRGLAAAVRDGAPLKSPTMEPGNITGVEVLAAHALWGLCGSDKDLPGEPWSPDEAKALLGRLEIHEHCGAELETEADRLLGLFFENGLAEPPSEPLLGWLMKRAVEKEAERRYFTIRELLAEMSVWGLVTAFDAATLRSWREVWDGVGVAVADRTAGECRLGKSGETVALTENQPEALAVLSDESVERLVVLGPGGAGKSVILRQLAERARAVPGGEVLWCGAADVKDEAEIEVIERACRFRASVLGWRAPARRLVVLVDALDEAEPESRARWAKTLARLAALNNVRLVVSVREEVWRRDADLRSQLETWQSVEVKPWPEKVIVRLLANNGRYGAMTPRARELLRTPILLDLFWRAFVEEPGEGDADLANRVSETRHGLIDAFWQKCLIKKPRYQCIVDFHARGLALWARAAGAVDGFAADGELAEVAVIAVSEGILVWTGHSLPRLAFRHPLLRDFALAQWALAAGDAAGVADRWRSIVGGVARRGVLRAMMEAMADGRARADWPALELSGLAPAIAALGAEWAEELAQFLGAREARSEFDPVRWAAAVQAKLPAAFGASLLTAARLEGEASWAHFLAGWGAEPSWLDDEFPRALASYAESLAERVKRETPAADSPLREAAKAAARYLRRLAEGRRFEAEFRRHEAWLCGKALEIVAGILPDAATFGWAERELARATWRVRSRLLDRVADLARTDAVRATRVYRQAIGLHRATDGWRIRRENWEGLMSQQVVNWTLGGEHRPIGLLREFPEAFFPVAVELTEALWRDGADEGLDNRVRFDAPPIERSMPDACTGVMIVAKDSVGALFDDGPAWIQWHGYLGCGLRQTALRTVHKEALAWAEYDVERCAREILIPLRQSRQGAIQGVVLDVMEHHHAQAAVAEIRRLAARDLRLYKVEDLAYWAGRLLEDFWRNLSPEERATFIVFLRANLAAETEEEQSHVRYFLGRLSSSEWPEDLRAARPKEGDEWAVEKRRPRWSKDDDENLREARMSMPAELLDGSGEATASTVPGKWAEGWDRVALARFYGITQGFGRASMTPEKLASDAGEAAGLALGFFERPQALRTALEDEGNRWFWEGMGKLLESAPGSVDGKEQSVISPPDPRLVRACAELALRVVEQVPTEFDGKMPEGDMWIGWREPVWTRALRLADEAFRWEPMRDDVVMNTRFSQVVETVFSRAEPLSQLTCIVRVRPWHWMRWRFGGEIGPWLVWRSADHPITLRWALSSLLRYHDTDAGRVTVLRYILDRRFELPSEELAGEVGKVVGIYAMAWWGDCRSVAVDLADEVLDNPGRFPLLEKPANNRSFLREFVGGMKEQAKHTVRLADLSRDYGRWTLAAWRGFDAFEAETDEEARRSGSVILHALYWLGEAETKTVDPTRLRPWWDSLRPLLRAVAEGGSMADCFSLFFNLRDQDFHHLATIEDVLGWGELLARRFRSVEGAVPVDLNERPARGGGHTWRECLGYAASAVGALRAAGSLTDERVKERARAVLAEMQAPPLRVPEARTELHRLLGDAE